MKRLSIMCTALLGFCLMPDSAFPAHYASAVPSGTKFFVDTYDLSLGQLVTIGIYVSDVQGCQNMGGAWIDFTGSTGQIAYVSAGRALQDGSEGPVGPWEPGSGVLLNEPAGPGTVLLVVAGLGGECPDEDGDLIVGRVVLERIATGEASITFSTIPGAATWSPLNDTDVFPHTLLITDDLDNDGIANGEDNCPKNYNPAQEDTYPPQGNGIGDACDCESNFNCDSNVDAADIVLFLAHFGRNQYFNPCANGNQCHGDFACDGAVDALDVVKLFEDFGR